MFELSNETWNPLFDPYSFNHRSMTDAKTGREYRHGEIYGIMQRYITETLKSSPYWTSEAEEKFKIILGAWGPEFSRTSLQRTYGYGAMTQSPESDYISIAAYNGGWEEKKKQGMTTTPEGFSNLLTSHLALQKTRTQMYQDYQDASGSLTWATYEAGPGYSFPNTISRKQEEVEAQVMKSKASGTSTLDAFLYRATLGFDIQNYFIFRRRRHYWASHAPLNQGGAASPPWLGMALYNNHGLGDFLAVETVQVPTIRKAPTSKRKEEVSLPLVTTYATRDGDRLNLFVMSRRVPDYPTAGHDGHTPVQVELPFDTAENVTLYRFSGDYNDNNLDGEVVKIEEIPLGSTFRGGVLPINERTGGGVGGIPPGATLLYVFEGIQ